MEIMKNTFEEQLSVVIKEYQAALAASKYDDASDVVSNVYISQLQTRCITAIERVSGFNSIYSREVRRISERTRYYNIYTNVAEEIGVAQGLLHDIKNGYLRSLEEIIHGDLFDNFLKMGNHLWDQKYKDAAAVMVGSTLEVHLKKLCEKNDIKIIQPNGKSKKADTLNMELAKAGVYTKLDQKNVTAWLGLRNYAVHGDYGKYNEGQVRLLIDGVKDFINRHPA